MSVTKKEVERIAVLAKLKFTQEELENFTHQMNDILKYMEKLNELNTDDVQPLSHPIEAVNVFRDDKLKSSTDTKEALKNAPLADENYFKVPKVIRDKSK